MQKKGDKVYYLVVLIFIISLILFLALLNVRSNVILDKNKVHVKLNIGNSSGFDVNETALTFGTITPGSSAQRSIVVENNYNFPIKSILKIKGDVAEYLIFENIVSLDAGEKEIISVAAVAPQDASYGNYSGILEVVFKRAF
ncbi:MAG TPA: hypothetical protein ENG87_03080 [Candidatus Pacearchaeota archaeon]|nr:hypothetical protein BMS3Abin17_00147 [archaeon BMS3Abin17]HDK42336.1 hypothetical protein [Candidatus Pacearchaeota archaeon]HDZ60294.1 hypothetical protein [Candidatus Pacearchaeota archaeon]